MREMGRENERNPSIFYLAERVREQRLQSSLERKKERKRDVQEQLGSVRVLELGFNKITILPLKMSKLT